MSNKKLLILLALLPILLIIGLAGINSMSNPKTTVVQPQTITSQTFPSKTDEQNQVTVEVTPKVLVKDQEVVFEVTFNTHSVPLDFNLLKISKLVDDKGNTYQPVSWSGGSGGHHLSGALIFPKLENTKSVELVISDIAGVDRSSRWDL